MQKSNNKEKKKMVEIIIDQNYKTVWVDNLHMAVRDDGIACIRLSVGLPEGIFEQVRFMTSKDKLKEFVDVICSTIKYYPESPKDKISDSQNTEQPLP